MVCSLFLDETTRLVMYTRLCVMPTWKNLEVDVRVKDGLSLGVVLLSIHQVGGGLEQDHVLLQRK